MGYNGMCPYHLPSFAYTMAKKHLYRIAPLAWRPSRSSYRIIEANSPFATYVWDGEEKILMISEQYARAVEIKLEDLRAAIRSANIHHQEQMRKFLVPV